jgi:PEP-CTERM motif
MKRTLILLAVLLTLAAYSRADTIKITSGSGKIYPFMVFPGYTLQFNGSGYSISIPQALDNFGGSLVNCWGGCDQIPSTNLFLASGGVLASDDPTGNRFLTGEIEFDAVSFVSSLGPNGILTVQYTAALNLQLFLVDMGKDTQIGPFVWTNPNQLWHITAQFAPDGPPGFIKFEGATLTSVPEPTTITLLGTGMLPILFGVRRRRKSNMLKTS